MPATMSPAATAPTAFKQQIITLITELHACDTIISDIRTNRRLGTTERLDRLEASLSASQHTINQSFTSWRRVIGSRMDTGDEIARSAIDCATRDLQSTVQRKLRDVATNRVRSKHELEIPGFGELRRRWIAIETSIIMAIDALGERFQSTPPRPQPHYQAPPPPAPAPPAMRPHETIISIAELTTLREHMKNSWVERSLGARQSCFVNVYDENEVRWERPAEGYIKFLPDVSRLQRPVSPDEDEDEQLWDEERPTRRYGGR